MSQGPSVNTLTSLQHKKDVKIIQTARYNGAGTVYHKIDFIRRVVKKVQETSSMVFLNETCFFPII